MATMDARHDVGGNYLQPEDGRDELGQLPEPLDVRHYPVDGDHPDVILLPGLAPSQRKGTSVENADVLPSALTPKEQHERNVADPNLSTKAEQGEGKAPNAEPHQLGLARPEGAADEARQYEEKSEAATAEAKATGVRTEKGGQAAASADKPAASSSDKGPSRSQAK